MNHASVPTRGPASPGELFLSFTTLALQGFGGVLAVAQRVLCEERGWLSREEFIEILSVAQVLPGPNVCNVALIVGDRFFGLRGALAALGGMMSAPLIIVLGLTALYAQHAANPLVAGALRGMGAVAAGLIAGTGLKLAATLRTNPLGPVACGAFLLCAFVAVALLRWPLAGVLVGLGVIAWALARSRLG